MSDNDLIRRWDALKAVNSRANSDDSCHAPFLRHDIAALPAAAPVGVQCCMCGTKGLSTAEDGGQECELHDGRWVCSRLCYDAACSLMVPPSPQHSPRRMRSTKTQSSTGFATSAETVLLWAYRWRRLRPPHGTIARPVATPTGTALACASTVALLLMTSAPSRRRE